MNPLEGLGRAVPFTQQHRVRRVVAPTHIIRPEALPAAPNRSINAGLIAPSDARKSDVVGRNTLQRRDDDDSSDFSFEETIPRLRTRERDEDTESSSNKDSENAYSTQEHDFQVRDDRSSGSSFRSPAAGNRPAATSREEDQPAVAPRQAPPANIFKDIMQGIVKLEEKGRGRTFKEEVKLVELKNASIDHDILKVPVTARDLSAKTREMFDVDDEMSQLIAEYAEDVDSLTEDQKINYIELLKGLFEHRKAIRESIGDDFKDKNRADKTRERIAQLRGVASLTPAQRLEMINLKNALIQYEYSHFPLPRKNFSTQANRLIARHNQLLNEYRTNMDHETFSRLTPAEKEEHLRGLQDIFVIRNEIKRVIESDLQKVQAMREFDPEIRRLDATLPRTLNENFALLSMKNIRLRREFDLSQLPARKYSNETNRLIVAHDELNKKMAKLRGDDFAKLNDEEKGQYLDQLRQVYVFRTQIKSSLENDLNQLQTRNSDFRAAAAELKPLMQKENLTLEEKLRVVALKQFIILFNIEELEPLRFQADMKNEDYSHRTNELRERDRVLKDRYNAFSNEAETLTQSQKQEFLTVATEFLKVREEYLIRVEDDIARKLSSIDRARAETHFQSVEKEIARLEKIQNKTLDQLVTQMQLKAGLLDHKIVNTDLNQTNSSEKTNRLFQRDLQLGEYTKPWSSVNSAALSDEDKENYYWALKDIVDNREELAASIEADREKLLDALRSPAQSAPVRVNATTQAAPAPAPVTPSTPAPTVASKPTTQSTPPSQPATYATPTTAPMPAQPAVTQTIEEQLRILSTPDLLQFKAEAIEINTPESSHRLRPILNMIHNKIDDAKKFNNRPIAELTPEEKTQYLQILLELKRWREMLIRYDTEDRGGAQTTSASAEMQRSQPESKPIDPTKIRAEFIRNLDPQLQPLLALGSSRTIDQELQLLMLQHSIMKYDINAIAVSESSLSARTRELLEEDKRLRLEAVGYQDLSALNATDKEDYLQILKDLMALRQLLFTSLIDDRRRS